MPFPTNTARHREVSGSRAGSRTRDFEDRSFRKYVVWGYEDPLDAEAYMINGGTHLYPLTYDGQQLVDYSWEEYEKDTWLFTYNYSRRRLDEDQWRFSVDGTGGNIKLGVSRSTTKYARSGETAPDYKSSIDVQDGKPRGVDRVIPALKLTLTYRLSEPADPFVFTELCTGIVGTTNSVAMLGHAIGELLFLGFGGEFASDTDPELTFTWAASKNATGLTIGDITSVAKKGHEYLWTLFDETETGTGADKIIAQVARAAYVEEIYPAADHLTVLGLTI